MIETSGHLLANPRAMESFGLTSFGDRWCKTYSGGQRRKVDIALGVIHRPQVLFLDEPTTGLAPQSRANLWDEVNRLRDEGMTIFITTHYLEEADQLCDRVAIIDQGTIVAEGTPTELKREVAGDVISLVLNGSTMKAAAVLAGQPDIWVLEGQQTDSLRLRVDSGSAAIQQIMRTLDNSDIELGAMELHRPSLDEVSLAKTGRSFGLRISAGNLALAYLLFLALALLAVTVSYGIALLIRNEAPLWLARVADWNPFYWATSALRALFANHPGENVVWEGALIVGVLTVLGLTWSTRLFARSLR